MSATAAATRHAGPEAYAVGDEVTCLAWVGHPFVVVAKDDEQQVVSIETPPGWPTRAEVDLFPETMFLLSHERWDQIWHWPDRAGERYLDVFERFLAAHAVGDVVFGYPAPPVLGFGARIDRDPRHAMAFQVDLLDASLGQARVHPVAAVAEDGSLVHGPVEGEVAWQRCGPGTPLRIEMRRYRWCLTFGELVLTWEDFT